MKKTLAKFLKPLSSNRYTQRLFSVFYSFSLFGLYGDEWNFNNNGELRFARSVAENLKGSVITVFDVGANVGEYSAALVKIMSGISFHIYAFEPSKNTFQTYSNKVIGIPNIIKENCGLGETEDDMILNTAQGLSGFASLYAGGKADFDQQEIVRMTTVDKYVGEREIKSIGFMKIDVEGHELSVLRGASHMIENGLISVIQFEFGAQNVSSRTFFYDFYFLLEPNYNIYRIVKNGLVRIEKYDPKLEVFGRALNYAAIHKNFDWNYQSADAR